MRLFTLHQPYLAVYTFSILLLIVLLLPKPSSSGLAKSFVELSDTSSEHASLAAESPPEPQLEQRAPVETPPTEYLPYRMFSQLQ